MPPGSDHELELFVRVLREVFDHQPWGDVERSARKAWRAIETITGQDWEDVSESIRQAWRMH
jgi:hypothetical protein